MTAAMEVVPGSSAKLRAPQGHWESRRSGRIGFRGQSRWDSTPLASFPPAQDQEGRIKSCGPVATSLNRFIEGLRSFAFDPVIGLAPREMCEEARRGRAGVSKR